MKKRILFVIDSLKSGGAEKSLISLISLLDYEKYEVDLLIFKDGGLYEALVNENVNKIHSPDIFNVMCKSVNELLNSNEYKNLFWRIKSSIDLRYKIKFTNIKHGAQAFWPSLSKQIKNLDKEYDVAIAYSQGTPTYYVAEKVKARKKICWINTDYVKAGYNVKFDKKYYDQYKYMVTVSNKNKEILEGVFPQYKSKIRVVYDIISPELVRKMANEGRGYSDKFNGIRILTIGRHVYLKGYDIAIEAANLLKEKGIKFRWYSIGEGVLTSTLKQQVKENNLENEFIFIGTYINPYPFINQCDIYCQPSRFEGFGMSIAEAKILNKPIIVTNFDIVYDQIENRKNGIIVNMNSTSLCNGIIEVINNERLREALKDNLLRESDNFKKNISNLSEIIN